MTIFDYLRRKHVLGRLRQNAVISNVVKRADFPIWARPAGVERRVRLMALRHTGYYLPSRGTEPTIAALMIAAVRVLPVRTFFDIGASIGYYTWLLKEHSSQPLSVEMFEPDPDVLKLVRRSLQRDSDSIVLHSVALSSHDGEADLLRDPNAGTPSSLHKEVDTLTASVVVPVRKLDSIVRTDLAQLVLVKIDVEGAEEDVLSGADSVLASQPIMMIECLHGPSGVLRTLETTPGYRLLDAMTAGPVTERTSNYFAVPPSVSDEELAEVLRQRDEIVRVGFKPAK